MWYEGVGLALVAPPYSAIAGSGITESFVLLAALSAVVMGWSAAFNAVFDKVEYHGTRRTASDRPHALRVVHACMHEATAVVVSCPVLVAMTDLSWWQALLTDLALTLTYAAYGYLFHLAFDRLRPVAVYSLANQSHREARK